MQGIIPTSELDVLALEIFKALLTNPSVTLLPHIKRKYSQDLSFQDVRPDDMTPALIEQSYFYAEKFIEEKNKGLSRSGERTNQG